MSTPTHAMSTLSALSAAPMSEYAVRPMRTDDPRSSAVGGGWTKHSTAQGADNGFFIANLTATERPLDPPNRLSA